MLTDKIGEESVNSFGSKMICFKYRNNVDIDVYFPEYKWVYKHATYNNFKKGSIRCPYEPRVCGKGYIGEGPYKKFVDGEIKLHDVIYTACLMEEETDNSTTKSKKGYGVIKMKQYQI